MARTIVQSNWGPRYVLSLDDLQGRKVTLRSSPAAVGGYPNNADCRWAVAPPPDCPRCLLAVHVESLDTRWNEDVVVWESRAAGHAPSWEQALAPGEVPAPSAAAFSGTEAPPPWLLAPAETLHLRLTSDLNFNVKGGGAPSSPPILALPPLSGPGASLQPCPVSLPVSHMRGVVGQG